MSGKSKFSFVEFGECFCVYCKEFLHYDYCKYTYDDENNIVCFHYQYGTLVGHEFEKTIGLLKTFLACKYYVREIVKIDGTEKQFKVTIDELTSFHIIIQLHVSENPEYIANSLSEYLDIIKDLSEQSKGECFYRGESQNYQKGCCNPSLFRNNKEDYEKELFYSALTKAPYEFDGLSSLDILAKMQHYGVPTRLLDVTTNPLCALFFAVFVENHIKDNFYAKNSENSFPYFDVNDLDGCVYFFGNQEKPGCLTFDSDRALLLSNLCKLTDKQKDIIRDYSLSNPDLLVTPEVLDDFKTKYSDDLWEAFTKLIYESERERTALLRNHRIVPRHLLENHFVKPKYSNVRLRAQSGLFIIFGLGGGKVYINPKDRKSPYDIKATRIIIPAYAKEKMLNDLKDLANINEYTIYPEFEHLAKCLK